MAVSSREISSPIFFTHCLKCWGNKAHSPLLPTPPNKAGTCSIPSKYRTTFFFLHHIYWGCWKLWRMSLPPLEGEKWWITYRKLKLPRALQHGQDPPTSEVITPALSAVSAWGEPSFNPCKCRRRKIIFPLPLKVLVWELSAWKAEGTGQR